MKIPKEIAEKARKYNELMKDAQENYEVVLKWLNDNTDADSVSIEDVYITNEATGRKQNDDEFCNQWTGYCEDDYHGK